LWFSRSGRVIGVDMTEEQLAVAIKHTQEQADRFGYDRSNVEFHKGYIEDPVLHGECLGGALYMEDFRRLLLEVGIRDYRVLNSRRIQLNIGETEARAGGIDFYSKTIRVFKLFSLEDICEDYGQMATYLGTIPLQLHQFDLDDHHRFIAGKPKLVCGNTADMLLKTRYRGHFRVEGERGTHFGPFDCGPAANGGGYNSARRVCC
jgi:arsenite methyltransferase